MKYIPFIVGLAVIPLVYFASLLNGTPEALGVFSNPFLSIQLSTSTATNGYVLSTDGTNNTWVAQTGGGSGSSNWLFDGTRLTPSTTVGIGVFASSTIGDGTDTGGLTINGGATTTFLVIQGWKTPTSTVVCMAPEQCQFQADGTGDDATFNSAVSYLDSVGGGKLYIKGGTYTFENAGLLYDNVEIVGSPNTVLKRGINQGYSAILRNEIFTGSSTARNQNIKVRGITFNGGGDTNSYSQFRHAIGIYGADNFDVSDNTFTNLSGDGVYVSSYVDNTYNSAFIPASNVRIANNHFSGTNQNRNGVSVIEAENVVIDGNTFYKMTGEHPGAIDLEQNFDTQPIIGVTISNNTFDSNRRGVIANFGFSTSSLQEMAYGTGLVISNNTFTNSSTSDIDLVSWGNVSITGNKIADSNGDGISVMGSSDSIAISGNSIFNSASDGVFIGGSTKNTTINGNTIRRAGNYAINSDTGASRINITSNYIADYSINEPRVRSGINLGDVDNINISNNTFADTLNQKGENLTANALAGTTSVSLIRGEEFFVGQEVNLSDTSIPLGETLFIASVSSTTITFTTALVNSYTTANTAILAGKKSGKNGIRVTTGTTKTLITSNLFSAVQDSPVEDASGGSINYTEIKMFANYQDYLSEDTSMTSFSMLGNITMSGYGINNAGFMSVGTTSTSSVLNVVGNGSNLFQFYSSAGVVMATLSDVGSLTLSPNNNNQFIGNSANNGIRFDGTGNYGATLNSTVGSAIILDSDANTGAVTRFFIGKDNVDPDSATQLFTVLDTGLIGVGSSTPSRLLTVGGNAYIGGNLTATGTATFANLLSTGSSTIGGGTGATGLTVNGGATTTGNAYFAGNVGIGTTTPAFKLTATGTVGLYNLTAAAGTPDSICQNSATKEITVNAATSCVVSARDQKDNISSFSGSALDMIMKLNPSTFVYRDNYERERIGFMADELQAVDSRLGDGYKDGKARSIDIPALIALNTKAIQELYMKVDGKGAIAGAKRSVEENYQWILIALLLGWVIRLEIKTRK